MTITIPERDPLRDAAVRPDAVIGETLADAYDWIRAHPRLAASTRVVSVRSLNRLRGARLRTIYLTRPAVADMLDPEVVLPCLLGSDDPRWSDEVWVWGPTEGVRRERV